LNALRKEGIIKKKSYFERVTLSEEKRP
jgi:hypothetical protein